MDVFGSDKDPRIRKLKTSMNYYQSMSQEGYTKHKPKHTKKSKKHVPIKLASEIEQQDERNKKNSQNKVGGDFQNWNHKLNAGVRQSFHDILLFSL